MAPNFHILLIDDSPSDALIIERALREGDINYRLTVLQDGHAALDYFVRLKDPASPIELEPDLVLLDLNLPGLDGCQVLTAIKSDVDLRMIPVVILTTSGREEDVHETYLAGANTFIRKPDEYPRYRELVSTLRLYWSETAMRPTRKRPL
jgi:CheY-like chemotaxis protein